MTASASRGSEPTPHPTPPAHRDVQVRELQRPDDRGRTLPQLITYVDRLAGDLAGLRRLLAGPLALAFDGVHVLPFYYPFDGEDAGFDPRDHTIVDARLGQWADVKSLADRWVVMADVIVNHMSSESAQFRDVVARGDESPWAPMFLTMSSVFPTGAQESDLTQIYRPRPGLPFTAMDLGGRRRLVWTTFTAKQVDLDINSPLTWAYLTSIIDRLIHAGVSTLRLDAVGYVGKAAGTDCFLTAESTELVRRISDYAHRSGASILLEVHGHYLQQIEIARTVDFVYDFALPPLVLHALTQRDFGPLIHWLSIRPPNTVTVLDTHDGIGIVDVGTNQLRPGVPGLLTDSQIARLVDTIHENSGGSSRLATGAAASNLDRYQINCTFYDALGEDDDKYLLARLIQLFVPGTPQIYYVGLLAGRNDVALLNRTGVGRDVNRHYYAPDELIAEMGRNIVRKQLHAIRFRAHHAAYFGDFSYESVGRQIVLQWTAADEIARLSIDAESLRYDISFTVGGDLMTVEDVLDLPVGALDA